MTEEFKAWLGRLLRRPRPEAQSRHDSGKDWAQDEVQALRNELEDLRASEARQRANTVRLSTELGTAQRHHMNARQDLRVERAVHRATLACLERYVEHYGVLEVVDSTAVLQAQAHMRKVSHD